MGYINDLMHLKFYVLNVNIRPFLRQSLITWLTASDEIRVLPFDIELICSEYGFKHNMRQMKELVCFAWLTVYLYWIWNGIIIWE